MIAKMDFIGMNKVEINYWGNKVWFNLENKDQFQFSKGCVRSMIISIVKVRKMLSKVG